MPTPPHCIHSVDEIWRKRRGGDGIEADNAADQNHIRSRKYVADHIAEMQVARSDNDQISQRVAHIMTTINVNVAPASATGSTPLRRRKTTNPKTA